jgi:hypothetical protein
MIDREKIIQLLCQYGFEVEKKTVNHLWFIKSVSDDIVHEIELNQRAGDYFITSGGRFRKINEKGTYGFVISPEYAGNQSNCYRKDIVSTEILLRDLEGFIKILDKYFSDINKIVENILANNTEIYIKSSVGSNYFLHYGINLKFFSHNEIGNLFINKELEDLVKRYSYSEDSKYVVFRRALIAEENLTPEKYQELRKRILAVEENK